MDVMRWFQEGGWPMWVTLLAALLAHGGVLAGVMSGLRSTSHREIAVMAAVCLVGGIAVALLGWGGYALGMYQVEMAIMYADPASQAELLAVGRSEAMNCVELGLGGAVLPVLAGLALVGRAANQAA